MNLLRTERIAVALALGLLAATPSWSQTQPNDSHFVLRDVGDLGHSLGQLGNDVKAVYDTETGQLVGFVAEKGGQFVAYTVDGAAAVAGAAVGAAEGIGGFFGGALNKLGELKDNVVRAIDEHDPFLKKIGSDFATIGGALDALDRDIHHAGRQLTGNALVLTGKGIEAMGELIADNPKGPVRQEGCDGPIATDGLSLWCQDASTITSFMGTWGKDAAERWAWEHSKDLSEGADWRKVAYGWD